MTSFKSSLIAAGLDLGSRNARIAIVKSQFHHESTSTNSTNNDANNSNNNNTTNMIPIIIPNEIGQRYTLALSMTEPETEADPLNDQYWENNNNKKKSNDKDQQQPSPKSYIFGDAARRTLHRLKQPLNPYFISNLISCGDEEEDDGEDDTTLNENLEAAQAFFSHLSTQATNANGTSAHPSSLRFVISVPHHQSTTSATTTMNNRYISSYVQNLEKGLIKCMKQIGYDTAPEIIMSNNNGLNKKEKKQLIQKIERKNRVLTVITNPIAIGHAHGIFSHEPLMSSSSTSTSWKNILIVEWGASSLTLTHISKSLGSTNLSSIENTITESKSCTGISILNTLITHTAEIFERNSRGMIPRGDTLLNKKAKAKLEVACEDALRSLGYSPKAHVTIDGLIDGIDCQVEIMLARFEMLLSGMLRMAETMIRDFVEKNVDGGIGALDGVLSSGGIMRMKCVDVMMNRIFQGKWRGKSVSDVAPEEAVALGCASFARSLLDLPLSDDDNAGVKEKEEEEENEEKAKELTIEEDVPISPVGIGLSLQEGDPAAIVMIEERTPLPALVTRNISLTDGLFSSLGVMQISKGQDSSSEKMIGRIEGIDTTSSSSVEVTMELLCNGQLSVLINGGESFVI